MNYQVVGEAAARTVFRLDGAKEWANYHESLFSGIPGGTGGLGGLGGLGGGGGLGGLGGLLGGLLGGAGGIGGLGGALSKPPPPRVVIESYAPMFVR